MKKSCACFFYFRAVKLLGWVKKAGECLNDLVFSVFINLVILCHICGCAYVFI